MIPIVMPIAIGLSEARGMGLEVTMHATLIAVGAVLSGAVFGDHASPISDTTILSSVGSGCPHLEHVRTQMPYAVTVALCASVGYLLGGIFLHAAIAWIGTLATFLCVMAFLVRREKQR